jgi:hypothetical protein
VPSAPRQIAARLGALVSASVLNEIIPQAEDFAASAGVGTNAMPLTNTVAIMPAIKVVAKWYMIPSFELNTLTRYDLHIIVSCRPHSHAVGLCGAFIPFIGFAKQRRSL